MTLKEILTRLYFNMASRDKGRRKWGGFSQESASSKLETEMRAGSNRAAQALYRPGSGPLRKSGRTVDDLDHENIPQDKQKASVQHRLRQATRSDMPFQVDSLADKLNDMNVEFGDRSQEPQEVVDARRRNKKPEQQLYVPKKVKEALAEQDTTKKSLVQVVWERDCERENSDCNPQSNRSHRYYRSGGNGDRVRDDFSKRYSGNRRSRQGNENEERWRSDSPLSARSYGCRKDSLREVRQGSEPLFLNHTNEPSRTRDTRSVEPDKFQGKPPSGRRGSTKESLSKNIKLEHLPPRLQMKYLIDNGLPLPSTNAVEESWNGSSITFQGSYNYPHTMQHSTAMQNLSPSGGLNPQTNWSNTVPARSRGRGRLRVEELEGSGGIHRSVTPDQYSATSSRSHTPSQEYAHRSYDRRGSNSTMYTSMESLSRADSLMMPPPRSISPSATARSTNRCLISPESSRRNTSSPSTTQRSSHAQRVNNNAYERSVPQEKQASTDSSLKSEQFGTLANVSNERPFDWCEEVELNEKLEAERLSRSSSVLSLRESASMPFNQHAREGGRRCKKKRRDKKHITDRSRDKARMSSRERQNNQQNRENDACSQRNNSTGRHFDHRRKRNIIQRSPEQSKDRNYRNNSRNFDDLHRHRDRLLEENWRTGRKMSTCDSEDGGQAAGTLFPNTISNLPGTHQTQASSFTSTPSPGLLVLSDANQSPLVARQQSAQQQRTLFDPKNPNKPIVVTSPSSRVALQKENEDAQGTSVPVLQPGNGNTSHQFHGVQLDSVLPPFMNHDQIGSMRPSWYDPYSDSFRSAKDPYLLLDIERADLELQWILSSGGLATRLDRVMCVREYLQEALRTLLERDMKFCQVENVEQHFWKILFYNIIEMLRKGTSKEEGKDHARKIMLRIIDEGTVYLESLLNTLETKYRFKLDAFLANSGSSKGLGILGLALVSAQKILLFLGDLARYREQANETTNYGKSRQWYLKAQQLNPKNGKPYNQLALLAHYARRKLDAVYYYMRSLMASNPFYSARECLIGLFDENRKKYESTERKRKEEREWKERARMREKEGASGVGGSLRRETWIHPGGRRVRRTTTTTLTSTSNASTGTMIEGVSGAGTESRYSQSDLEELTQLTSAEVNKRFITSYLHVHGKLITKIGMETFQEAAVQMLKEFRALLQHSPLPLPGTRLLQLLALNMFAIESTQLKDSQMEQGYRSELQERALVVSLQMFNMILERSVSLLRAQLESREELRMVVAEDMQVLLPAIKIWCDWMLCHSTVWNPPPSCTDYRLGPPGDAWSRLATMVNLLEKLNYSRTMLIQAKDAEGREEELELVKLPEDSTLAGFTPLMSNPQDPCYAEKTEDMEVAQVCLRISKILFFGQVFLCGLETPVLKLQKSESGISEYVSVVEASSTSSPSSPPEQSDSELLVESYSEDEDQSRSNLRRLPSCNEVTKESAVEIRSLIERKEELERRQRKQDRHRLRVQAILQKSSVSVEIEVRPRQLVPDTNCFIDYLPQLQSIIKATSGAQPIYTLMVPLVVLNELEGLARGADAKDCPPASRAALDPDHVARVAESAKVALSFARSRNPAIRCLTTRGTVLTSSTFTVEEDVDTDGLTSNDDRILATCLSLCKSGNKDQSVTEEGQPRRLRREVVLLTEDRNLRVKALARDVPVREVPDFMQWAGLG